MPRKVVVGHWEDKNVHIEIGTWNRAAAAALQMQHTRIARFGDNMRDMAVTEGNKVSAQIDLGFSVHGFGVGDLVHAIDQVDEAAIGSQV